MSSKKRIKSYELFIEEASLADLLGNVKLDSNKELFDRISNKRDEKFSGT